MTLETFTFSVPMGDHAPETPGPPMPSEGAPASSIPTTALCRRINGRMMLLRLESEQYFEADVQDHVRALVDAGLLERVRPDV
jgi:hypothetical protein